MNLPEAVLAAMALCNHHIEATRGAGNYMLWSSGSGSFTTIGNTIYSSSDEKANKLAADENTKIYFNMAYAWEPPYQNKCKFIQEYVSRVRDLEDKQAAAAADAKQRAAKAAEQPTLDNGIMALRDIKPTKQK